MSSLLLPTHMTGLAINEATYSLTVQARAPSGVRVFYRTNCQYGKFTIDLQEAFPLAPKCFSTAAPPYPIREMS